MPGRFADGPWPPLGKVPRLVMLLGAVLQLRELVFGDGVGGAGVGTGVSVGGPVVGFVFFGWVESFAGHGWRVRRPCFLLGEGVCAG